MKHCQGCTLGMKLGERWYRVRCCYQPSEEAHPPYCLVDAILDETSNIPVGELEFAELKSAALTLALQKCAEVHEGRRDAAREARGGHA